jgi:NitT/TauT family transport system substrate-binding protein
MTGRVVRQGLTAALVVSVVAGCGLLSGNESSEEASSGSLELSSIKVSVLPAIDTAPLWRAVSAGYFEDEGLTVEPVSAASGPDAVNAVVSDEAKIGFTSYPAAFNAQAKGVVPDGLRLVAGGYAAAEKTFMVVAGPGSGIRTPEDLAGKRIAVTATGTISDLGTIDALEAQGVDSSAVKWAPIPFPDMNAKLQSGDVDAAVMVEPWITKASQDLGAAAVPVMDCAAGDNAEIPLAGWMATKAFTEENPKTVAAFERGLARAADEVTEDRAALDEVLVDNLHIDKTVAGALTPGTFFADLDPAQLQRVVDLMHKYPEVSTLPDAFGESDLRSMISTGD